MTPEGELRRLFVGGMAVARDDLTAAAGASFDIAAWMVEATAYNETVVAAISFPGRNFRAPGNRVIDAVNQLYRCAKTGCAARHVVVADWAGRSHSVSLCARRSLSDPAHCPWATVRE